VDGVALDDEIGRGFTSNAREDTESVFDLKTLSVEKKIKVGSGPDAVVYDPFSKRVFLCLSSPLRALRFSNTVISVYECEQ
jgi:YVTN family beta-propeller protein